MRHRGCRRFQRLERPHRHERRHLLRDQNALSNLTPPSEHQTFADAVAGRHAADPGTRFLRLSYNPKLVRNAPAPPTLPPAEQFHHTVHLPTLTTTLATNLRRREDQTQAVFGGGIRLVISGLQISRGFGGRAPHASG